VGAFRVKVAYVSQGYSPHDRRFLNALAANGVDVFHFQFEGRVTELRGTDPACQCINVGEFPSNLRDEGVGLILGGHFDDCGIQIVLCGPLHTIGAFIARNVRCVMVQISHAYDVLLDAAASDENLASIRAAIGAADGLFVDCEAVLEECRMIGPIPQELPILNIPWGIELQRTKTKTSARKDLLPREGWGDESVVLLSIRSLEEIYQLDQLLLFFREAKKEHHNIRLVLVGGGSLKDELHRLIEELGLAKDVCTPGWITESELSQYFEAADVYISTAKCDGSSISLLQAMNSGVVSMVNRVGGNVDWVEHGENGWLFDMNLGSFLRCLDECITSRSQWAEIRSRASELVHNRADWQKNSKALVAYLDGILVGASG
jgi:glycosyltransferase involved in cell wall biosynthesis